MSIRIDAQMLLYNDEPNSTLIVTVKLSRERATGICTVPFLRATACNASRVLAIVEVSISK